MHQTLSLRGSKLPGKVASALVAATLLIAAPAAHAQALTGAGATFINPIMSKWIAAYKASTGVEVNYQPIGSGGGINALISKTVDFCCSDVPMNGGEEAQVGAPTINIPDIVGAVVVSYSVPGVGPGIALNGKTIADIFEGKITYWDDPEITRLSPGTKFPHENILVVHRSDGSGTTAIFTGYLSKVSGTWKETVGAGKSVSWPVGLGAKGNPGVAGYLKNKPYSIGYVELAYAIQNDIPYAKIKNKSGVTIYPSDESAAVAAEGIKVPANLKLDINDSPNKEAYPIVGVSNLIVRVEWQKNAEVKKFVKWILTEGQKSEFTGPLHYSPLPEKVRAKALEAVAKIH
ncbi:MAG: phosphate ABC transporter substrate-binding protein PstS [Capsulimonadaceae bacterium]|nr:phosphate ABC transporter substrate-binding protein PstS [Capsulimonadaceae bacterium]